VVGQRTDDLAADGFEDRLVSRDHSVIGSKSHVVSGRSHDVVMMGGCVLNA
jgi:selenophosphate synthetase-related protein